MLQELLDYLFVTAAWMASYYADNGRCDNLEVMECLLRYEPGVDIRCQSTTLFAVILDGLILGSSVEQMIQRLKLLLEDGADPNQMEEDIDDIHFSAPPLLHILLRQSDEVSAASGLDTSESMVMLWLHGAEMDKRDSNGSTAQFYAFVYEFELETRQLLEHGAKPSNVNGHGLGALDPDPMLFTDEDTTNFKRFKVSCRIFRALLLSSRYPDFEM